MYRYVIVVIGSHGLLQIDRDLIIMTETTFQKKYLAVLGSSTHSASCQTLSHIHRFGVL